MFKNWKIRREENSKKLNGYYNLSNDLRVKADNFDNNSLDDKIGDYFTIDEFCEILTKTTYYFYLTYGNCDIILGNDKKGCFFTIEGTKENKKGVCESYSTPQELFENAILNGKAIREIWHELIIK